jgi:hypothetical protein
VDHYERLAVERDAPTDEIRAPFRAGMRRHHPDAGGGPSAREVDDLVESWRVLRNPGTDGTTTSTSASGPHRRPHPPTWGADLVRGRRRPRGAPASGALVVLVVALALLTLAVLVGVVIGGFTLGPTGL